MYKSDLAKTLEVILPSIESLKVQVDTLKNQILNAISKHHKKMEEIDTAFSQQGNPEKTIIEQQFHYLNVLEDTSGVISSLIQTIEAAIRSDCLEGQHIDFSKITDKINEIMSYLNKVHSYNTGYPSCPKLLKENKPAKN